jgi:hypothetical protein
MLLTPAQKQTLKAAILADVAIAQTFIDGNNPAVATYLNGNASPAFWVWRTAVEKRELVNQVSRTGTSFTWAGNGFITRSVGELECFNQLFNSTLTCNPSLPNVRQAFIDIFSGTGNAASNRSHLDVVGRRQATRVERVFATGNGQDTSANAGLLVVEGPITDADVSALQTI